MTPNRCMPLVLTIVLSCGGYRSRGSADAGGPDCADDPAAAGCPCQQGGTAACYEGPAGTDGVGRCTGGERRCSENVWGPCVGEVLPRDEMCDNADDDCDGETDEGLLSECGDCDPGCEVVTFGHEPGEIPFDPSSGPCLDLSLQGDLVAFDEGLPGPALWIPNTAEGTVSRIDTRARVEVARYRVGAEPSRTATDGGETVFVASRGAGGLGSATRIDGRCADRDGDGLVETSTGRTDVLPLGDDECVAWHVEVGDVGAGPLAIARESPVPGGIDGPRLWVGLADGRFVSLDADTGEETGINADVAPCVPVGAGADRNNRIWVLCEDGTLANFLTWSLRDPVFVDTPFAAQGMAMDDEDVLIVGEGGSATSRTGESWVQYREAPGTRISPEGWVGACSQVGGRTQACRFTERGVVVHDLASRAVAVDPDGFVWGVPLDGFLEVLDPASGEVERVLDDCDAGPCLASPDAFSDFVQQFEGEACTGVLSIRVPACALGETTWKKLSWEVETPGTSGAYVEVRAGRTERERADAPLTSVLAQPGNLLALLGESARGTLLEVKMRLDRNGFGPTPVLHRLTVERSCGR